MSLIAEPLDLCGLSTVVKCVSAGIAVVNGFFGQTNPAEKFLASEALHMLAALNVFDHRKTMDTCSVFWSFEIFLFVSISLIGEFKNDGPRGIAQKFLQKFPLFISTEFITSLVPFLDGKEAKVSELAFRADHTIAGQIML